MKLAQAEYDAYIKNVLIPGFTLVNENFYSVILDRECRLVICTNKSARTFGAANWQEIVGMSYGSYADPKSQKAVFKRLFSDVDDEHIPEYCQKIYQIQQNVIKSRQIVSIIDMLPYAGKLTSYLVSYVPIIHQNSEVIGIQTFSVECRFFSFQEHLKQDVFSASKTYSTHDDFTKREIEILFLLAHGVTQDQIAQILEISRSSVATVITRLCSKFEISGSNTKILSQAAIKAGIHHQMPESLWKPCIIVLQKD